MFTGIVQAMGRIGRVEGRGEDLYLWIDAEGLDTGDVSIGDSIAVNGVCLTVVDRGGTGFGADVSRETLACTTLGRAREGVAVNLEKALLPTTRLGGHWVSGHVDGVARLSALRSSARSLELDFEVPDGLQRYIAQKGSVCVDGVSLTVNRVRGTVFSVNIIPHTQEQTTIGGYRRNQEVNIEVDVIARYLERLLRGDDTQGGIRIDETLLAECGFLGRK